MDNRRRGTYYEQRACQFLGEMGYGIVETNFLCKSGEIDIIAVDGDVWVFVEVKFKKSARYGQPYEMVHYAKQQKIGKAAMFYRKKSNISDQSFRFDIISILGDDIEHYKNAFVLSKSYY